MVEPAALPGLASETASAFALPAFSCRQAGLATFKEFNNNCKRMHVIWFKKWGWFYRPVHFMGWFLTLLGLTFMAPIALALFRNGHSVSDDLYQLFVYGSCTVFWWTWVAGKTSKRSGYERRR